MTDLPLFTYPHGPGHRGIETSIEGARKIAPVSNSIRDRMLKAIKEASGEGFTTEEVCRKLAVSDRSGQPRTADLKRLGLIRDSGQRRKGESGINIIVWVAI